MFFVVVAFWQNYFFVEVSDSLTILKLATFINEFKKIKLGLSSQVIW